VVNNLKTYNKYEAQEAIHDLELKLANFDQIDLTRFTTYFKNMIYKYGMYKVHKGDVSDDNNYHGERPDPRDNYYRIRTTNNVHSLEMIAGLSEFPQEDIYRSRLLNYIEI
jgi:hypothetical protein